MEKEFVPYEEALALKELGFEELCFGFYREGDKQLFPHSSMERHIEDLILAPIYQQAFRWLNENSFNENGDSLVQDYLDTRWFRTLFAPVHQDITLKECIKIFKENCDTSQK